MARGELLQLEGGLGETGDRAGPRRGERREERGERRRGEERGGEERREEEMEVVGAERAWKTSTE